MAKLGDTCWTVHAYNTNPSPCFWGNGWTCICQRLTYIMVPLGVKDVVRGVGDGVPRLRWQVGRATSTAPSISLDALSTNKHEHADAHPTGGLLNLNCHQPGPFIEPSTRSSQYCCPPPAFHSLPVDICILKPQRATLSSHPFLFVHPQSGGSAALGKNLSRQWTL